MPLSSDDFSSYMSQSRKLGDVMFWLHVSPKLSGWSFISVCGELDVRRAVDWQALVLEFYRYTNKCSISPPLFHYNMLVTVSIHFPHSYLFLMHSLFTFQSFYSVFEMDSQFAFSSSSTNLHFKDLSLFYHLSWMHISAIFVHLYSVVIFVSLPHYFSNSLIHFSISSSFFTAFVGYK